MADIIHRIGIRAPAAKVREAVATTRGVAGWWTRDATGSGAAGNVNARFLRKDGKEIGQMDFEVSMPDDGEVRWRFLSGPPEWIGTHATFQMAEEDDMTILVFGHRNWKEPVEFMAHCSLKWAVFLLSLRELVETGTGHPSPDDVKIDNWN